MTVTRKTGRTRPWIYLLLIGALFAAGCSSSNESSGLATVDAQGNHPAGFVSTHGGLALPDGSRCTSCHGDDLQGGIARVSCSTASFNGQACHAAGPAPANHQPITTWINAHQGEAAALRPTFAGCNAALCHGPNLQGAVGPSCFSAAFAGFLCHAGGPPPDFHPAGWYVDHRAAAADNTASCSLAACHGPTLHADPPDARGPSCFRATWGALACHAGGPGTGGGIAVEGAHNEHLALGTIVGGTNVINCATCHSGPTGPPQVTFITPFPYTSQSGGPSTFDNAALTCSAVSCHGGQVTPNWLTGTIDPATQCESCHQFDVAQFNSYSSGQHDPGGHNGETCTACHDPALLAPGHFANLPTAAFEQPPIATLRPGLQYNGTTCNPDAGGITGCHGQQTW